MRRHVDRDVGYTGDLQVDGEVCRGKALFIDVSGCAARFINYVHQTGFRAHDISLESGPRACCRGNTEHGAWVGTGLLDPWGRIRVGLTHPWSVGTVLEHRSVLCDVQDLCRSTTSQQIERNASTKEWLGMPQEIVQLPGASATEQSQ